MSLSAAARAALAAERSTALWVALLTVTAEGASAPPPLRLCSVPCARLAPPLADGTPRYGLVSRGEDWDYLPMEVRLPDDRGRAAGDAAELRVYDPWRRLAALLRTVTGQVGVVLEVVRAAAPDVVEVGPLPLELSAATLSHSPLILALRPSGRLQRRYPDHDFTPGLFPGLF